MEWQTLDPVTKVQAYFADQMSKGDWTITFAATASGTFSATFKRKSDNRVEGTLVSSSASGVTKILMSLITPSA